MAGYIPVFSDSAGLAAVSSQFHIRETAMPNIRVLSLFYGLKKRKIREKKNVPQAKFRLCLFSSDVNVKLKLKINIRFNGFLQIFWKISFVNNDFKKRKFKLRKLSNIQAATPLETSIGT